MTDMQSVSFSLTGRSSENEWAAQEGEARKESDDPEASNEQKEGASPESEKRRKGKRKKTSQTVVQKFLNEVQGNKQFKSS